MSAAIGALGSLSSEAQAEAASAQGMALSCQELVAACEASSRSLSVRKNKDVLVAGYPYDSFYVTRSGWLIRYKILHNGFRQIVDFILPGDVFGLQLCLFKTSIYSIAAVTDASLYAIPISMTDKIFHESPRLSKALFWSAIREAAIVSEHLTDAARRSAYERLSHLLLELFIRSRRAGLTRDMSFETPLTQEHIGDALGLTTVHVNRTLRSLREDKLVNLTRGRVTILDYEAMCLLSDFEHGYLAENDKALRDSPHPAGREARLPGGRVSSDRSSTARLRPPFSS